MWAPMVREGARAPPHNEESPPLLLIRLEMGVGDAQLWHRHLGGIAACDQIADYMIGLHRRARLDVAKHRRRHLRTLRGQHALGALEERSARRGALGRGAG